ncbi:uncharacterized protein BDV17DRAFT_134800 [Aspergillus undulatus]|uniref:uncharacterized protein n=1 Tax=Aspergillus undulatus TaxID=1810928 RepID=UPI003CCDB97D
MEQPWNIQNPDVSTESDLAEQDIRTESNMIGWIKEFKVLIFCGILAKLQHEHGFQNYLICARLISNISPPSIPDPQNRCQTLRNVAMYTNGRVKVRPGRTRRQQILASVARPAFDPDQSHLPSAGMRSHPRTGIQGTMQRQFARENQTCLTAGCSLYLFAVSEE